MLNFIIRRLAHGCKMKKIYLLIGFLFLSGNINAAIEDDDWQNYLTKTCNTTISGSAKKLLGERSFWAHVNVSMDSWAESMRIERPEDYCRIDYQHKKDQTKLLKCLAYQREKWDWYRRCKPVVISACKSAGGYCTY